MSDAPLDKINELFPILPPARPIGESLLRELPPAVSILAMRLYRSLMLCAAEPYGERDGILTPEAMARVAHQLAAAQAPDGLRLPLILIAAELAQEQSEIPKIGLACLCISDWAFQAGSIRTAVAFADAAACVVPTARYALVAGRIHRKHGDPTRAELWFHHAEHLATRTRDWITKARSLLSLATSNIIAGRFTTARQIIGRALNVAKRYRIRELIGEANHDLFVVAFATQDHSAAEVAIAEAIKHYGPRHDRLPYFAHDLAVYWIERRDCYNALAVLDALLDRYWSDEPVARLLACGTKLRALGELGEAAEYETLSREFHRLLDKAGRTPVRAQALLQAGRGAVSLRRWITAETLLTAAAGRARESMQNDTLLEAERLLDVTYQKRTERLPAADPSRYAALANRAVKVLAGGGRRIMPGSP